jgi:hypothetical protein
MKERTSCFMCNLLSVVPKAAQQTVGAIFRTIFIQADHPSSMEQLPELTDMLRPQVLRGGEPAGGGRRGSPGPPCTSRGAPPAPPLDEPPGAAPRGDQATDLRSRDLPQPGRATANGGDPPPRVRRRVAGRRPSDFSLGSMKRIDELEGGGTRRSYARRSPEEDGRWLKVHHLTGPDQERCSPCPPNFPLESERPER